MTSISRTIPENGAVVLGPLILMSICMGIPAPTFRPMRKLFRTATRV